MPGTVIKDQITTMDLHEQNGVIWTLRRGVLVHSITDPDTGSAYSDFRVLKEALNACTAVGLAPQSVPEQGTLFDDLRLVERIPSLVPGEKTKVRVVLIYEQFGSTLDSIPAGQYLSSGSATLGQTLTQKDRLGNDLFVGYTYPSDYAVDETLQGKFVVQGGEVHADSPNDILIITGRLSFVSPGPQSFAQQWRGHVNSALWRGGIAETWLCTSVEYELYLLSPPNLGPPLWTLTWTFQYDPAKWEVGVRYTDPRTGKAPSDLIPGVGIKPVDWYPQLDFNGRFPG